MIQDWITKIEETRASADAREDEVVSVSAEASISIFKVTNGF